MKLSIIIVSFNTKELLMKCLESIVKSFRVAEFQSCRVEIVVVDNGSTDGSVDYINGLTKLRINGLVVKTILNRENVGFAKAVNQALRETVGEGVLLLNSDTRVKPGALEGLLGFEKKVRPAIIGARLLNPDGSVQASVFHLPTLWRAIKEYWLGKTGEFSKYTPRSDEPVEVEAVLGGAMLISRGVIEKIGLFDERYFMYFEDLDYCRRAKKAGFRVYYLPSAKVIHEHGASGKSLAKVEDQWKRLIPSSKIYHGAVRHYLINSVIWLGQKFTSIFSGR